MRKQFELRYLIGWTPETNSSNRNRAFSRAVINAASELCGGCYVGTGKGYWIEGETKADRFQGEAIPERCLSISLTTEPAKLESVIADMQAAIADLVAVFDMPVDWVHVQQTEIMGRHFSVTAAHNAQKVTSIRQAIDLTDSKPITVRGQPWYDTTNPGRSQYHAK